MARISLLVACREQMQAAVERIQAKAELADDRRQLLGLLCLAAAHSHICASLGLDKKLTKGLLDLHRKVACLPCPALPLPCRCLPLPAPHCPALPCPALPCHTLPRPAMPFAVPRDSVLLCRHDVLCSYDAYLGLSNPPVGTRLLHILSARLDDAAKL